LLVSVLGIEAAPTLAALTVEPGVGAYVKVSCCPLLAVEVRVIFVKLSARDSLGRSPPLFAK
jgi:hypothetical protein